jgi:pimeloyl-ACP methyl ester carboxylesterase
MTPTPPDELRNAHGERLSFTFTPGAPGGEDLVVMGHGVTSDRDRPWSEGLAAALAEHGIASLRIAFSGNGESEGAFADSTITKEVADLGAVLDACEGWRTSYVGHSMGGAVGLLRALVDDRIHALVSLAAVTHTREFVDRVFGHLSEGDPMLDKPHCPFSLALRADLEALGSLAARAREVRVPWLAVHGDEDEIVPLGHSLDLLAAGGDRLEFVRLDGVDHSFSGAGLGRMIGVVTPWLVAALAERG